MSHRSAPNVPDGATRLAGFLDLLTATQLNPVLPTVPAAPGHFRIFIETFSEHGPKAFEPILDPVIAWRIDNYAVPVTADEFDEQDGSYAILHPSGRVTYPFVGEFPSLIQLADFVNLNWRTRRKKIKRERHAELIAMFG